jgi:hypothetical protein
VSQVTYRSSKEVEKENVSDPSTRMTEFFFPFPTGKIQQRRDKPGLLRMTGEKAINATVIDRR